MNIIIDTNVWISFAVGKNLTPMRRLLTNPELKVYVCKELLEESALVASRPRIRRHLREDDIRDTRELMKWFCHHVAIGGKAVSAVRDKKDAYLLSLAETVSADFVVTGDQELLALHTHHRTRIVTYKEFAAILGM